MNARDAAGRMIRIDPREEDHREAVCDYVRRALRAVSSRIEDYLPDEVYTGCPGRGVVVRLPFDGPATIEVDTETLILED